MRELFRGVFCVLLCFSAACGSRGLDIGAKGSSTDTNGEADSSTVSPLGDAGAGSVVAVTSETPPVPPAGTDSSLAIFNYLNAILPVSATASIGCDEYRAAGYTASRTYLGGNAAAPVEIYCEQTLEGGGWALLHNSLLAAGTTQFWQFPHAERLARKGVAHIGSNFYDGSLYTRGREFMDVIEDINGNVAVAFVADSTSFDASTMRFQGAHFIKGNVNFFNAHFAGGWSASDYDGDTHGTLNCAALYSNVAQHYDTCWYLNLGSDGDAVGGSYADSNLGPHVMRSQLTLLGLAHDGSLYSRVKRISRFVRW